MVVREEREILVRLLTKNFEGQIKLILLADNVNILVLFVFVGSRREGKAGCAFEENSVLHVFFAFIIINGRTL